MTTAWTGYKPTFAILNSRKGRFVSQSDRWLRLTWKLTELFVARGYAGVSSIGNLSYNAVSWKTLRDGGRLICVALGATRPPDDKVPPAEYGPFIRSDGIRWTRLCGEIGKSRSEPFRARDRLVASLADILVGVEIQAGGNMERLLNEAIWQGKHVLVCPPCNGQRKTRGNANLLKSGASVMRLSECGFQETDFEAGNTGNNDARQQEPMRNRDLNPECPDAPDGFVWHFTRRCNQLWPGETWDDFFLKYEEGDPSVCRSAFYTLRRILEERRIRGSSALTRGKTNVVSFTAAEPRTILNNVRWESHLIRWTFEPCAIGFQPQFLTEKGAQPVLYGSSREYQNIKPELRPFFQRHEPPEIDWRHEREIRVIGDLDFSDCPNDALVVLVGTEEEKKALESLFPYRIVSIAPRLQR